MSLLLDCIPESAYRCPQVILAREFLKTTSIGEKQVKYIVEQARRGRVQGHRAELFAVRCRAQSPPAVPCLITLFHLCNLSPP